MEAHATLPDGEDFQRIGQVVAGLVEQHLSQPAAENDAEHTVEQQVVELFDSQEAGAVFDAQPPEQNKLNEGDQIHQTVPAYGKRADGKGNGVELRV